LAASTRAAAAPNVDRVPEEYATIQQAVDQGSARVISVAAGEYAGALVSRGVAIVCRSPGACAITSGDSPFSALSAGFVLDGGASGASIRGFEFAGLDLGVFASCESVGSVPSDVSISQNTFVDAAQAITLIGGCDDAGNWSVARNRFEDLRSDISECGGGLGVWVVDAARVRIEDNQFTGTIAAPPCGAAFTTAGISLSGVDGAYIARNRFALGDGGHPYKLDIALLADDGASHDIRLFANDASESAAPFEGVNFFSVDNFSVRTHCNVATISLQHANGDGVSQVVTEDGCGVSKFHAAFWRIAMHGHRALR
jgi:hypothetical protein